MQKLALFDIDKTLIMGSKAKDTISFPEAFRKIYNVNAGIDIINPHGMTDQQIIIEVMRKKGLNDEEIMPKLRECMQAMIDSFSNIVENDNIIVLDGVKELLEELNKNDILIGLVTGNLEQIARAGLKKAGIDHYFSIGGFGSDDINRTRLVHLAIKRAEQKAGFKQQDNVFLFGDAPQDMKAGKEAGIKTIGVTTGIYSKEDLEDAGADFVLENLKDKKHILDKILQK